MSQPGAEFWESDTTVRLTSMYGWNPSHWGCIGWTGSGGLTRRTNILAEASPHFIMACSVTGRGRKDRPDLVGKIAGFYVLCHEVGHRDRFTHPRYHSLEPDKWQHSIRALHAFSCPAEYAIPVRELMEYQQSNPLAVAGWTIPITHHDSLARLREMPWTTAEVFQPVDAAIDPELGLIEGLAASSSTFAKAGPASTRGYRVEHGTADLPRQLYALKLTGDTSAWLGAACDHRRIYKIGLSYSPEGRCASFNANLPRGVFRWEMHRTEMGPNDGYRFPAAVTGEDAIKRCLHKIIDDGGDVVYLGGEFYLASDADLNAAWATGVAAANAFAVGV